MATVDIDLPHVKDHDHDPHHHGPAKGDWSVVVYDEPQRHWKHVSDLQFVHVLNRRVDGAHHSC